MWPAEAIYLARGSIPRPHWKSSENVPLNLISPEAPVVVPSEAPQGTADLLSVSSSEGEDEEQEVQADEEEESQAEEEGGQPESPQRELSPASSLDSLEENAQAIIDLRQRRATQRRDQLASTTQASKLG
ncbi:bromodomain-containing protein 2-like [Erythrolamprus reginae]|uniref:bromodomain-containing protein 2-like n=1 Tax=Erythrolamprus reginae TaxID=121349 RepID=UPI00396CEA1F